MANLKSGGSNSVQGWDEPEVYISYNGTVAKNKKHEFIGIFKTSLHIEG